MRIWLLGGFRASVENRTIEDDAWRLKKAANLVKLLALSPSHRLHREQIMEALWPDLGTDAASNNLRGTVHSARDILEPNRAANSRYLDLQEQQLVLCPRGHLWVDVEAFEEAAAIAHRAKDPAAYRLAIELYAGELLPEDRYEEWAEGRREELRRQYLALLVELADRYEERGEHEAAVEALRRVTTVDPTQEEAHSGLMRLYALSDRRTHALSQYERLRKALSERLGTEPSASTRRLYDEIAAARFLSSEPAAPTVHAPAIVEPLDAGRHNLPAPRSSFIGRERELREVKRDLVMTRLLTLTGAGGCGKTRLALEVARDLVGAYPDGVWFVELAPLSEGALVAQAVAAALGVQEQPERSLTDTLVDFLRIKRAVLILDNCEHLVDAVARLADVLLNSCIHLKVLATSRENLNVEGELIWLVPSLSTPGLQRLPTVEELAGYESVRLFVERARHRNPAFSLTPDNAHAVARICGRLDGIPLAIELAAARVGFSVEQIATRLDDSLRLLTAGSRTAPRRQRTLRGTLDWSYALLSEPEQRLFGRLSVFAGGWTLQAAEVVGAEGDTEEGDVLDLLFKLVEKSLVVAEATEGGGARYKMLEPIKQYARERLEECGEDEEVRRRHATFFLALAEEAEPRLRGPEDMEWLERLEAEHDNLRTALSWALEQQETEWTLQLAGALWHFWEARGHYGEGKRWLEESLKREIRTSADARAKALDGLSWFTFRRGDTDRAKSMAEAGLRLSHEAELTGAWVANFLHLLGWMEDRQGDHERAKELLEESLKLSQDADNKIGIARSLMELGNTSYALGDRKRAKELYEAGVVMSRESRYTLGLVSNLISMSYVLILEGDYERAKVLNEEAAALLRERGYINRLEHVLYMQGWVALLQDDPERARTSYEESLTFCRVQGDKLLAAEILEGLACVTVVQGMVERATILFGAAEALREAGGVQHTAEDDALRAPYHAAARSQLNKAMWEAMWAEGRAMPMEQAIEYAFLEEKPTPPTYAAPERSPDDESLDLTSREREVAILVARGLTNRQIAQELVLSEHTVITHVRNILKKLNLHSRTKLTLWITERQPRP